MTPIEKDILLDRIKDLEALVIEWKNEHLELEKYCDEIERSEEKNRREIDRLEDRCTELHNRNRCLLDILTEERKK